MKWILYKNRLGKHGLLNNMYNYEKDNNKIVKENEENNKLTEELNLIKQRIYSA